MVTSPALLQELSDFIAGKLGLSFPAPRWRELERSLQPEMRRKGFDDFGSYARWLLRARPTPAELESLASTLTVGETYFFREYRAFEALREHILPELVASRRTEPRQLRLWSAGCCTGEEAYSLAIFFQRQCPELHGWQISILGTDVNPHSLRKARAGIYRQWSFRGAPAWLQSEYFTRTADDEFHLKADIKKRVRFETLNLVQDGYPSDNSGIQHIDVIFCRNVLMYFSPEQARQAIARFNETLSRGGHLVVGVCEVTATFSPPFHARPFQDITIFQKRATIPTHLGPSASLLPPNTLEPLQPEAAMGLSRPQSSYVDHRNSMAALIAQAKTWLRDGDYARVIARLQPVLETGLFDIEAATLLARAHANQREHGQAERWLKRALLADKLRPALHYLLAMVLQERGEVQGAADALKKALYLDSDFVVAHLAMADLCDRAGRKRDAGRHRAHALRSLHRQRPEDMVPESEGLSAGRLIAILEARQLSNVTK